MSAAKRDIEAKWQKRMEKEKEAVSERLLDSLDDEGRAELMDNGWLKREVCHTAYPPTPMCYHWLRVLKSLSESFFYEKVISIMLLKQALTPQRLVVTYNNIAKCILLCRFWWLERQ